MERLTTDQENALFSCFNIFYAKGGEIWVRGGGPYPEYQDVTLVQWIRSAAQKHGLNIMAEDPEHLGDEMYDALQDGDETVEGIVALLHAAAVQATEMRERLKPIEDILGDDYGLNHLRELLEADREGRCVVLPCKVGDKIYEIMRHRNSGKVEIQEYFVNAVETSEDGVTVKSHRWRPTSTGFLSQKVPNWVKGSDFGKTVFLTREAAEKALKERDHGDVYL